MTHSAAGECDARCLGGVGVDGGRMTFVDACGSAVQPAACVSRVTISNTMLHIDASKPATSRVSRRFQQDMARASQKRHSAGSSQEEARNQGDSGLCMVQFADGIRHDRSHRRYRRGNRSIVTRRRRRASAQPWRRHTPTGCLQSHLNGSECPTRCATRWSRQSSSATRPPP